jgi:hypothetical protein
MGAIAFHCPFVPGIAPMQSAHFGSLVFWGRTCHRARGKLAGRTVTHETLNAGLVLSMPAIDLPLLGPGVQAFVPTIETYTCPL